MPPPAKPPRRHSRTLSAEGYRLLGVAWRDVEPDRQQADVADETDLIFGGFLAFLDPPKAGARDALTALGQLGISLKVVTGDNEEVTRHVCGELGVAVTGVLNGTELAHLTDEALLAKLDDTNMFCRVTPPQKSRIIAALRRKGHVVGYLGDGINDAPSLHAADIGFSVDTAVDVAKEAAAMILLRKDLGVLAEGVREGRRTFANILKYMMMGTSSNFGNMFSMAGGVLFLPFLPMLPIQILLNNLLYDLSETTIPLDRVSDSMVAQPRRWNLDMVRKFMLSVRADQFDIRLRHLRPAALGLPGGRSAVSYRLVRRIALDANPGDLHHPHRASPAGSTASRACGKFAFRLRFGCALPYSPFAPLVRLRAGARRNDGRARCS